MARPFKPDRPKKLEVMIPSSLHEELVMRLMSPTEGKVPFGVMSTFVEGALRAALANMQAAVKES